MPESIEMPPQKATGATMALIMPLVLLASSLLLPTGGYFSAREPATGEAQPLKIKDIRAHLFYEHSGTLSGDLTEEPLTLWNVFIGEGTVAEPADDLLVVVVIEGPPSDYREGTRVRLTVRSEDSGKPRFEETIDMGSTGPNGEWAGPFLLRAATCLQMTLEATIVGTSESRSEVIEFRCGE